MLFLIGVVCLLCTVPATAVTAALGAPWWMVPYVFGGLLVSGNLLMIVDLKRKPRRRGPRVARRGWSTIDEYRTFGQRDAPGGDRHIPPPAKTPPPPPRRLA